MKEKVEKKQRTKFHEYTAENDIKYRGPLNYQHFQILGWACIVAAVAAAIISLGGKVDAGVTKQFGTIGKVMSFMAQFSLPLLLMAQFAKLLNNEGGYKKLLLVNFGAAVGVFAAYMLFGGRYFIGTLEKMIVPKEEVVPMVTDLIGVFIPGGFLAFNMFVDMFICTLTVFFLNVQPKRVFTGKKVLILRFMVLLPIGYEAICFWLKLQAVRGAISLPLWSFPLLTMKPPVMILLFIVMAFVVKLRETRYRKHGNTYEEYEGFMQTNRNAFHLSVRLCILMVVFAVIDLFLFILLTYLNADAAGAVSATGDIAEEVSDTFFNLSLSLGIGKSWQIIFLAPFMLLFCYNTVPKNKTISMIIPIIAIAVSVIIVFEAGRMGIGMLMEGKQIDLKELEAMFTEMMVVE